MTSDRASSGYPTDEKQVWFELDGKQLCGIVAEGAGPVPKPDAVRDLYVIET